MKTVTISGSPRAAFGKKETKSLRKTGQVPCVLYGGSELVHFTADSREFNKVIFTPDVYTIDLSIDGKNFTAVLHDKQYHPITDELIHADFLALADDKKVNIDIPVKIIGNSAGVRAGGKLIIKSRKLKVSALPANLPDSITVDITELNIGQSIKVADIKVDNVVFLAAPNVVVATVATTRAAQAAANEAAKGKK